MIAEDDLRGVSTAGEQERRDKRTQQKVARHIYARHSPSCSLTSCDCTPSYRVRLWDGPSKRHINRTFVTLEAAKAWHANAETRRSYSHRAKKRRAEQEALALRRQASADMHDAYSYLRKAQQGLDRAVMKAQPPLRGILREALDRLYQAEDTLKEVV